MVKHFSELGIKHSLVFIFESLKKNNFRAPRKFEREQGSKFHSI